ncbi:MAG: exodeoxyribonuclease VII large subunit, partial [Gammaproteobacteria bacterium]|nr:exodeoxyribonuclease VII large subunit [Gammaproteobacteria bacterium]
MKTVLTVSELNQSTQRLLEECFPAVWVEGEISNLVRPTSGHIYFSLKDPKAQIRCA